MVSSACFGDKLSLCPETRLAAAITHGNVFTHMKHLLWTTFPSLFSVSDNFVRGGAWGPVHRWQRLFDKVAEMNDTLSRTFTWNMPMLLLYPS